MRLNRSMAQLRHLNERMFKVINDLWVSAIGRQNLFKFKFTLTYIIEYLEEYLNLCEQKFKMIKEGDAGLGDDSDIQVNKLAAALDGFVQLHEDPDINHSLRTKHSSSTSSKSGEHKDVAQGMWNKTPNHDEHSGSESSSEEEDENFIQGYAQ